MRDKTHSDHTRSNTPNKPYRANCSGRVAGVVQTRATGLDRIRSVGELRRRFLSTRDGPQPRPRGVCFGDCYLGDDFAPMCRRREDDRYTATHYPFHARESDARKKGDAVDMYLDSLALFLDGIYFANEAFAKRKLAMISLSLREVDTWGILFEVGKGDDCNGMGQLLEDGIFGKGHRYVRLRLFLR